MIDSIGNVSIFVSDQDRAKRFYTEVLGCELLHDAPVRPGSDVRWVAVIPARGGTEIALLKPHDTFRHFEHAVGKPQAIIFNVSGMDKVEADLKAKGVSFVQGPEAESWGTYAVILDSEGNELMLVEKTPS